MTFGAYFTVFTLLIVLAQESSCTNQCVSTDSQDIGKNIQGWFQTLGKLSDQVTKSCIDLPGADKVRKLEKDLADLNTKCNATDKHFSLFKTDTEAKIAALQRQLQDLASEFKQAHLASSVKKIRHGVLERKGDRCQLKCSDGAFAYPSKNFSCRCDDYWNKETPKCILAKSCKDVSKYVQNAKSGVYKIARADATSAYDVYCDMATDQGGWTLVAVVANSDNDNWSYSDADKDFGDRSSLWENSVLLGKVDKDTPTKGKDFKSLAYIDVKASELLIAFKGKSYIQTDKTCIGENSLKQLFNVLRFSCAGSSYSCKFGKCLGKAGRSLSGECTHLCNVNHFYTAAAQSGEPLANGLMPSGVLLKTGEANGAQDGNKDRVYISTLPYRNNVDYVPGLGSFTSLNGKLSRADIGIRDDVAKRSTDRSLYYGLFVR